MTIQDNVLETMAPVPYAQLRDSLRDGDIVLCQGRDPFSRLIQWSTKSVWSHVGMVFRVDSLEQVIVIEAVEKIGVRAVALSDFVSRDSAGTKSASATARTPIFSTASITMTCSRLSTRTTMPTWLQGLFVDHWIRREKGSRP